jgi:hypothetical protein
VGDSWLHEAVCRQRPEVWPIFGSSIVTVFEVTERSVSSSLWRKYNSNLSLYCTPNSATVTPFLYKLCSYSHYLCALLPTVHCCTIDTINTTQPVIMLQLYCNNCNVIIFRTLRQHFLGSSNILSQVAHQSSDVDSVGNSIII